MAENLAAAFRADGGTPGPGAAGGLLSGMGKYGGVNGIPLLPVATPMDAVIDPSRVGAAAIAANLAQAAAPGGLPGGLPGIQAQQPKELPECRQHHAQRR